MRFISKRPQTLEVRVFEHFAWLPITIGRETRWLERVRYKASWFCGWSPSAFIDEDEE